MKISSHRGPKVPIPPFRTMKTSASFGPTGRVGSRTLTDGDGRGSPVPLRRPLCLLIPTIPNKKFFKLEKRNLLTEKKKITGRTEKTTVSDERKFFTPQPSTVKQ